MAAIYLDQNLSLPSNFVYSVIADVEAYDKFVPHVLRSQVYDKESHQFKADLDISVLGKKYTYTSHVCLGENNIEAHAKTKFGYLDAMWEVKPKGVQASHIMFSLHTNIAGLTTIMPQSWPQNIMNAFTNRCYELSNS